MMVVTVQKANVGERVGSNISYQTNQINRLWLDKELEHEDVEFNIIINDNNNILSGQRVIGGMAITDVRAGKGVLAKDEVTVYIGFTGKLPDGIVFDDSTRHGLYYFIFGGAEVRNP